MHWADIESNDNPGTYIFDRIDSVSIIVIS